MRSPVLIFFCFFVDIFSCVAPVESSRAPLDEHMSAAKRMRPPPPPEMVKLAEYYYGQMVPKKAADKDEANNPTSTSFKCPVCQKIFNFNTAFTRHLFMHLESARSFSIDLSDLTLCKYCFRNFGTPYAMQTHVEEVISLFLIHWSFDSVKSSHISILLR